MQDKGEPNDDISGSCQKKRLQLLVPHGTLVSPSSAPVLQKPPWPSGWIVTLGDSAALLPPIIGLLILTYPSELGRHLDMGCSSDSGAASAFPGDPREERLQGSATDYISHCPQTRSYGHSQAPRRAWDERTLA